MGADGGAGMQMRSFDQWLAIHPLGHEPSTTDIGTDQRSVTRNTPMPPVLPGVGEDGS